VTTDPAQLYELLGLEPGASAEAVRAAVADQRRVWRRRTGSADMAVRQEAERRMQQLDEAERMLVEAPPVPLDKLDKPPVEAKTGTWLVRAIEQLDAEQYDVATFTARRAVAEDPGNAYGWSVLAEAAARAGEHAEARDAIEHGLSLKPEDPAMHAMRGWVLAQAGDLPRAVSAYRSAAKLSPNHPDHRVRAVRALIDAGSLDEAIAEGEAAYQAAPEDGDTRTVLAQALAERAVAAQHELPDGRLLIVNPGQASHVESLCNRGLSVEAPDAEVNEDLRRQREYARKALRRGFSSEALRRNLRWPAGLGMLALASVCCTSNVKQADGGLATGTLLIAVVMVAAFGVAVFLTCFEPVYRRNARVIEHTVPRRLGRGPL
jgi:predicted Zn-dependent protease